MDRIKNVLICVDDSQDSMVVLAYAGRIIGNREGFRIRLFHILPPLPPALLEFGGAESPQMEEAEEKEFKEAQASWKMLAEQKAKPVLERAKAVLAGAHVPAESIETHILVSASGENLVTEILQEARFSGCDTVVVGRKPPSWLERVQHHMVADSLVREGEGLTIWVVEEPKM